MPKPNGHLWRHCRAQMDITSDQAGALLGITGGALRQIEQDRKPVSLALAYRAERLYKRSIEDLIVDEKQDPTPAEPEREPAVEPKVEPTGPPGRKNGKSNRRGPTRLEARDEVGAA